ncbi:hypothetical protein K505DRAFT_258017 [Melanomma pulvis-pyrius CBS 109.77]|uniref:Ribosomal protein bL31m N-terminal domain-containing protein n=1 Tax=Melanomma pulvis-pyrius CBS 109.77 TaxID=1314802 RepID=A0A6A6WT22_9PLEO|nr:hypothetical protein K505DRAFT_258017 [Melanomma pulvis-pyrius CBS 109.77]
MSSPIPSPGALRLLRRAIAPQISLPTHQVRHATLLRRPKRPYTFTQLVTLSDGSTFLHRTTSPAPVYKSTKDQRNTPLWNPSSQKLLNVEEDEAGKLAAFRAKFGRGWDAVSTDETSTEQPIDHLLDLISGQQSKAAGPKSTGKKAQAADAKSSEPALAKGVAGKK